MEQIATDHSKNVRFCFGFQGSPRRYSGILGGGYEVRVLMFDFQETATSKLKVEIDKDIPKGEMSKFPFICSKTQEGARDFTTKHIALTIDQVSRFTLKAMTYEAKAELPEGTTDVTALIKGKNAGKYFTVTEQEIDIIRPKEIELGGKYRIVLSFVERELVAELKQEALKAGKK